MSEKIFRNRATSLIHDFINNNKINETFILPANICPIVPLVFYKNKIKIKFIDIDKQTLNLCKNKVFSEIKNSSGILWNHTYGKKVNQEKFFEDIKRKKEGFLIIDDKCLCAPDIKLRKNLFSDIEIYSTGYSKYCDLGYGGFGISNKKLKMHETHYIEGAEQKLKTKIQKYINQKKIFKISDNNWLRNKKINNILLYMRRLKKIKDKVDLHKKKINSIYNEILPQELILDNSMNLWRFNIIINKKKVLLKEIFNNRLFASSHYFSSSKLFENKNNTCSDTLSKYVVNLFNDFRFSEKNAYKVCEIIIKHYHKYGPGKRP